MVGALLAQVQDRMSSVSLAVTRPAGRALLVGSPSARTESADALRRLGFECSEHDDPYAAMAAICQSPTGFAAVVLGLQGLYREELTIIRVIKHRFPHIEIWLAELEGRQAALAEAMRLGADGLVGEEGLHRMAISPASAPPACQAPVQPTGRSRPAVQSPVTGDERETEIVRQSAVVRRWPRQGAAASPPPRQEPDPDEPVTGAEPILTAEELRALLQESPSEVGD
jgi:hypothetical protein